MKSTLKFGAAVGVLSLATFALAQAGDDHPGGKSFNDLDRDQDSRVSMVEAQSEDSVRSVFTRVDKNADGYLSLPEYVAWKNAGSSESRPAPPAKSRSQLNPEVDPVRTPDSGNPAGQ